MIPESPVKYGYDGNGSNRIFDFPSPVVAKKDVRASVTDAAGVETHLAYPDDYAVSLISSGGAEDATAIGAIVTLSIAAPEAGTRISVWRETPRNQELNLTNQGPYFAESTEKAFDKLTLIAQELRGLADTADANIASLQVKDIEHDEGIAQALATAGNAVSIAESAVAKSNAAVATANEAKSIAQTASGDASAAIATANAANAKSDAAVATAGAANAKSDAAVSTANDAETTADNAKAIAEGIDGKAQQALDAAGGAAATANDAAATAGQAVDVANAANAAAANAAAKADSAVAAANGAAMAAGNAVITADNATATANAAVATAANAIDAANAAGDTAAGAAATANAASVAADEAKAIAQAAEAVADEARTAAVEAVLIAEGIAATAQEALDVAGEAMEIALQAMPPAPADGLYYGIGRTWVKAELPAGDPFVVDANGYAIEVKRPSYLANPIFAVGDPYITLNPSLQPGDSDSVFIVDSAGYVVLKSA